VNNLRAHLVQVVDLSEITNEIHSIIISVCMLLGRPFYFKIEKVLATKGRHFQKRTHKDIQLCLYHFSRYVVVQEYSALSVPIFMLCYVFDQWLHSVLKFLPLHVSFSEVINLEFVWQNLSIQKDFSSIFSDQIQSNANLFIVL